MNWKEYEKEILSSFENLYRDCKISFDQKIIGKYSEIERQIDVLIEGNILNERIKIIVDGKNYSKKLDVKAVDSFISMAKDVEATHGILITNHGYSEGAYKRAYNDPSNIELDILRFDDLLKYQGFGGIVHKHNYGFVFPNPFGWIVDNSPANIGIGRSYQRGLSFETAISIPEFMYFDITLYEYEFKNFSELKVFQDDDTKYYFPDCIITYEDFPVIYADRKVTLRFIDRQNGNTEITSFIDYDEYCVFIVLYCKKYLIDRNLRKLKYVVDNMIQMNVIQ
jgi:hypothetical protein